jgi:hypothetical protein
VAHNAAMRTLFPGISAILGTNAIFPSEISYKFGFMSVDFHVILPFSIGPLGFFGPRSIRYVFISAHCVFCAARQFGF